MREGERERERERERGREREGERERERETEREALKRGTDKQEGRQGGGCRGRPAHSIDAYAVCSECCFCMHAYTGRFWFHAK